MCLGIRTWSFLVHTQSLDSSPWHQFLDSILQPLNLLLKLVRPLCTQSEMDQVPCRTGGRRTVMGVKAWLTWLLERHGLSSHLADSPPLLLLSPWVPTDPSFSHQPHIFILPTLSPKYLFFPASVLCVATSVVYSQVLPLHARCSHQLCC